MKIGLYCISVLCKKKIIELYLFTYTGFQHNFHIRWCSCRLTVTLWVSHVEQELLTFLEHLTSPLVFSGVCVAWYLVFCVDHCLSFCPFWTLYCLSFDLRLLIAPLVSSNFCYSSIAYRVISHHITCKTKQNSEVSVFWTFF
jgi:hypothetical protein